MLNKHSTKLFMSLFEINEEELERKIQEFRVKIFKKIISNLEGIKMINNRQFEYDTFDIDTPDARAYFMDNYEEFRVVYDLKGLNDGSKLKEKTFVSTILLRIIKKIISFSYQYKRAYLKRGDDRITTTGNYVINHPINILN